MKNYNLKRFFVVIAAVIINLCLGSILAWSIIASRLKVENPEWTLSEISAVFSIAVCFYAFSSLPAGILQDRFGPRKMTSAGALIMGLGLIMSSRVETVAGLYLWYGVVNGIGIGFSFVGPLAVSLKYFPEKRGLIGGVVMGAYGAGGLLFSPLNAVLINTTASVSSTLFILGIVYLLAIGLSAQLLVNPPAGFIEASAERFDCDNQDSEFSPLRMLRTLAFYCICLAFMLGWIAGLTLISNAQDVAHLFTGMSQAAAVSIVGLISIPNAIGSPVFGAMSDRAGWKKTLILLLTFCAAGLFILPAGKTYISFLLISSVIMFCNGGLFGILPGIVSNFYGNRYFGSNYGLVYLAYGVGAMLGPRIAASLADKSGREAIIAGANAREMQAALASGFSTAFYVAGAACLLAMFFGFFIKKPFVGRLGEESPRRNI